jgi:hypothetical protein
MQIQVNNDQLADLLSVHFVRNHDPVTAWNSIIASHLLIPGLRGVWPMSSVDETGDTYDMAGQGRVLNYNGNPTYNHHSLAPYIDMDGAGDYLNRLDEAGLDILGTETIYAANTRGLTLGGWCWFDAPSIGAATGLIGKYGAAGNRSYLLHKSATNFPTFTVSVDGTAIVSVVASAAVVAAGWYHIVGRFDPSTELAIFVNGVKTTNVVAVPASIFNGNTALVLGGYSVLVTNLLDGRLGIQFLSANYLIDSIPLALYHHSRAMFGR